MLMQEWANDVEFQIAAVETNLNIRSWVFPVEGGIVRNLRAWLVSCFEVRKTGLLTTCLVKTLRWLKSPLVDRC